MAVAEPANFVTGTATKLLERLAYQVRMTQHSHHAEPVHDLRVSIRRLTQALVAFRDALPRQAVKRMRRQLKPLMEAAGDVRDSDVVSRMLAKHDLPGAASLKKKLQEHRKAAIPILVRELDLWTSRHSASKWHTALLACPASDDFHPGLRRAARRFLAHGQAAVAEKASVTELHRLRIEAKKFRYALELFEPSWGAPVSQWLECLKPVQSCLGDIHDSYMALEMAGRFGFTPEIEVWLKRRQRRKTREFRRLWQESFPTPDHALRIDSLRRPPRKLPRSAARPVAPVAILRPA